MIVAVGTVFTTIIDDSCRSDYIRIGSSSSSN